jgi:hypothetical protein
VYCSKVVWLGGKFDASFFPICVKWIFKVLDMPCGSVIVSLSD